VKNSAPWLFALWQSDDRVLRRLDAARRAVVSPAPVSPSTNSRAKTKIEKLEAEDAKLLIALTENTEKQRQLEVRYADDRAALTIESDKLRAAIDENQTELAAARASA
jgi:hypothetical protein